MFLIVLQTVGTNHASHIVYRRNKVTAMVDIILNKGQSGYDVVGEYIIRYWNHNITDTVIVSIGTSYDGISYELRNEIACPMNFDDIEYLYDWWEGERFIKIYGIKGVGEIEVFGGIYTE